MARYFVNSRVSRRASARDGQGRYWRSESYSGWSSLGDTYDQVIGTNTSGRFRFNANCHLLAHLLGDTPPRRVPLVPTIDLSVRHADPSGSRAATTLAIQPWEPVVSTFSVELPIGTRVADFLDDPLGTGNSLDLSLPFLDPAASVSQAWIRAWNGQEPKRPNAFHGGFDFSAMPEWFADPRPLIEACAAATGKVWMLLKKSKHGGGVVLRHEPAPGKVFATLYQHVDTDTMKWAVGDTVERGQRIGRIYRWTTGAGNDISHLHFNVLVRAPRAPKPMKRSTPKSKPEAPWYWFAIDPFGVYDEHVPDTGTNGPYVSRERNGMEQAIRRAVRRVHWRGNPPIRAFAAELQTDAKKIRQLQMRGRDASSDETTQMLVWLEGESERYYLRLGAQVDRVIESQAMGLLKDAYARGRHVQLGYRFRNDRKEISAVWVVN